MKIDKAVLSQMLLTAADHLEAAADELSRIDSRFGDGDHGITMGKIAKCIRSAVPGWEDESMADFLDDLGMSVMAVKGGSAGPLYGTLISGLGSQLGGSDTLDGAGAKAMLEGSLAEMEEITTARVGDKTMMDALIPAVAAGIGQPGDAPAVWQAAAEAGKQGAENSKGYIAKFGRAKSYKEQTLGTPDAGAISVSIFLNGMYEGLKQAADAE